MLNPIALRIAKTLYSFGHFECYRVNAKGEYSSQTAGAQNDWS